MTTTTPPATGKAPSIFERAQALMKMKNAAPAIAKAGAAIANVPSAFKLAVDRLQSRNLVPSAASAADTAQVNALAQSLAIANAELAEMRAGQATLENALAAMDTYRPPAASAALPVLPRPAAQPLGSLQSRHRAASDPVEKCTLAAELIAQRNSISTVPADTLLTQLRASSDDGERTALAFAFIRARDGANHSN